MSNNLYPPPRPQSVAEVLDSAFRVFRATVVKCLPYGALAVIVGQLQNIYDLVVGRPLHRVDSGDAIWWTLYAVGALLALGLWNATALRQYAIVTGRAANAAAELGQGLRRAPILALLLIVVVLLTGLCFLPALALPPAYRLWGYIVLAVPATFVGVALSCSWTALLLADKGVLASMTYSFHLVSGNWWRLTAIYTVGVVMLLVFYVLAGMLAMALVVPFAGSADIAVLTAVSAVVVVALGAVGTPFYSALALTVFGDLRARKEGADLEQRIAGVAAE